MKALKLPTIALLVSLSFCAFAGPNDGGGGQGWVCRNADRSIRSAKLLDLWEGEEIFERIPIKSTEPVQKLVADGIQRLKHSVKLNWMNWTVKDANGRPMTSDEIFVTNLTNTAEMFLRPNFVNVQRKRGKRLTKTHDAYEDLTPDEPGCEIEQIVRYKDIGLNGDPTIFVNQDIVDKLDNVHYAGLILHEAYYALLRVHGETTSLRVRRAVSWVMSGRSFTPLGDIVKKPYIYCDSYDDDNKTQIYFTMGEAGILTVPVVVNKMLVSGFTKNATSLAQKKIEEYFEDIQHLRAGYGWGSNDSPTDFDLRVELGNASSASFSSTFGRVTTMAEINNSASGVTTTKAIPLICKMVK